MPAFSTWPIIEEGPADGPVAILLHGFPYDIHSYVDVAPQLAAQGCRVIVPYLRGFGTTRFRKAATPRSGEQAAIGADVIALMDALGIRRAVIAGYNWGGRAACVAAALWPERCAGMVTVNSYLIQDLTRAILPISPKYEMALWYEYYFQLERGRAGIGCEPAGDCEDIVEAMVAALGFRRGHIRPHGGSARQSRFCRRRDP